MAYWDRFIDLLKRGTARWHTGSLEEALAKAKTALGEKMFAAGIDDGQLAVQIAVLNQRIHQATAPGLRKALLAARQTLILQLAEAALEEDSPLPGADAEYQKVREIQSALQPGVAKSTERTLSRLETVSAGT